MKITTQDDIKKDDLPDGMDAKVVEGYVYWCKIERIVLAIIFPTIYPLLFKMIYCLGVYEG